MTINAGRNCNLVAQYPAKFTVFSEFQLVVYCLTFVVYRVTVIFLKEILLFILFKKSRDDGQSLKIGEKIQFKKEKVALYFFGPSDSEPILLKMFPKRGLLVVLHIFHGTIFSIFSALLRRSEKSLTFNRILQCHFYFLRKQFPRDIYRFSSKFKQLQISTY